MGNSEVGHLNLGAGRMAMQAMTRIDGWVKDGILFQNPALLGAIDHVKGTERHLHLMGLVSDGGVHSWPSHYLGLLKMAKDRGLDPGQVYFHAMLDGRDTPASERNRSCQNPRRFHGGDRVWPCGFNRGPILCNGPGQALGAYEDRL